MKMLLVSSFDFLKGITSRAYFWLFALLLDPFDLYDRFRQPAWPEVDVPAMAFWTILGFLILWTAILTYHELRVKYEPHQQSVEGVIYKNKAYKFSCLLVSANRKARKLANSAGTSLLHSNKDNVFARYVSNYGSLVGSTGLESDKKLLDVNFVQSSTPENYEEQVYLSISAYLTLMRCISDLLNDMKKLGTVDSLGFRGDAIKQYEELLPLSVALQNSFIGLRSDPLSKKLRTPGSETWRFSPLSEI